jgi:putative ABC transport system permease protein
LAMLIAYQAVSKRIDTVKASVGNTVSVSPAGVQGFEGGGNALTGTQLAKLKSVAHVSQLDESLNDRLTTSDTSLQSAIDAGSLGRRFAGNSGQGFTPPGGGFGQQGAAGGATTFTPPVTVVGTTDPSSAVAGGTLTLKSGQQFSNTSTDAVALVGTTLATKNNLQVGSTFTAYGTTITVAGIYDTGTTFGNSQLIMPLATVQKLSAQPDAVTSATLTVDSITNVNGVTTAVKQSLGSAADVTNAAVQAQQTVTPLQNIQTISLYSLIGAVIAGAVIILLTMVMIVRERRREIGVIKAIGASNLKVMLQFTTEAVTLTVLGAVVGVTLGVLAGNPITKLLVNDSTSSTAAAATRGASRGFGGGRGFGGVGRSVSNIHAVVGWSILLYGLAAALIIAVTGSLIASFFIAKIRPAEVMRTE